MKTFSGDQLYWLKSYISIASPFYAIFKSMFVQQKAPNQAYLIDNFFFLSNYWLKSYIKSFSQFHGIFPFLGHPVWWKYTLNNVIYVLGTKGYQKAPTHKGNFCNKRLPNSSTSYMIFFCKATILMEVIYFIF